MSRLRFSHEHNEIYSGVWDVRRYTTNNSWDWEGNENKPWLSLGARMGMNHWEQVRLGLKKTFPLISTSDLPTQILPGCLSSPAAISRVCPMHDSCPSSGTGSIKVLCDVMRSLMEQILSWIVHNILEWTTIIGHCAKVINIGKV